MSTPGLGAKAWAGWGKETTWGTAATRTEFYKIMGGESVRLNQSYYPDPSLGGASVEEVLQGTKAVGGDLPLAARYEGLGLLFKHPLGAAASAQQGESTAYKHTFTPEDDLLTGLTLEIYRDAVTTKSFVIPGCKLSKGVFRIERDQPLVFTPTFFGKGETLETKGTPTYPTAALILPSQLVVTASTFTGTVDVLNATIEVNNPLTEERFDLADSGALKEMQRSDKRTVLGTIEGEFSEEAQYADWTGGVEGNLIFTWTGALIELTYYYELVVTLHAIFTGRPPQVADARPVKMTANFQAFKDGSTPDIKIELTNTVTSIP